MTLEEAFARIEELPQRDRVMLGRLDVDTFDWIGFNADALDLFDSFEGTNKASLGIAHAVDEFRFGGLKTAVLTMNMDDGRQAILVLGPTDLGTLGELISESAKQLATRVNH